MRAAFEKWISADPYDRTIKRNPSGSYEPYSIELAWHAWQYGYTTAARDEKQRAEDAERMRDRYYHEAAEGWEKFRTAELELAQNREVTTIYGEQILASAKEKGELLSRLDDARAEAKRGWDAFYRARKDYAKFRYPNMTGEVRAKCGLRKDAETSGGEF